MLRLLQLNPFLEHYLTLDRRRHLRAEGTTGAWWAAAARATATSSGPSTCARYAGEQVEVALTFASDDLIQLGGVDVDDIVGPGGAGSTSFEHDGDALDGWTVPGAPRGHLPNPTDWIVGTAADTPPTVGEIARGALDRQPEILGFLAGLFGPYPFSAPAGSSTTSRASASRWRTRRARSTRACSSRPRDAAAERVVVHELAHQWIGDSLAVARWQHIWLNEGFATYAEWLWSEREGRGTAQELFDDLRLDPGRRPVLGARDRRPGPRPLFDAPVYDRGAMTLHALRAKIGDGAFFRLLKDVGARARGRQRHDPAVHRAGRADLGPGSRRPLQHLAVHGAQARLTRSATARSSNVLPSVARDSIAECASAARSSGKRWPITGRRPAPARARCASASGAAGLDERHPALGGLRGGDVAHVPLARPS